jgi:hypothetical protein
MQADRNRTLEEIATSNESGRQGHEDRVAQTSYEELRQPGSIANTGIITTDFFRRLLIPSRTALRAARRSRRCGTRTRAGSCEPVDHVVDGRPWDAPLQILEIFLLLIWPARKPAFAFEGV